MLLLIWILVTIIAVLSITALFFFKQVREAEAVKASLKAKERADKQQLSEVKDQLLSRTQLVSQLRYAINVLEDRLYSETQYKAVKYTRGQLPRLAQRVLDSSIPQKLSGLEELEIIEWTEGKPGS